MPKSTCWGEVMAEKIHTHSLIDYRFKMYSSVCYVCSNQCILFHYVLTSVNNSFSMVDQSCHKGIKLVSGQYFFCEKVQTSMILNIQEYTVLYDVYL